MRRGSSQGGIFIVLVWILSPILFQLPFWRSDGVVVVVVSALTAPTSTLKPSTTRTETRTYRVVLRYQNGRHSNNENSDSTGEQDHSKWYKRIKNVRGLRRRRRRQGTGKEDEITTVLENNIDHGSPTTATTTTEKGAADIVVARNLAELRQAVLIDKIPLQEIDCRLLFESEESENSTTINATTVSSEQIRTHPVLQLLQERHSTNSTPGKRIAGDTAHVALSIEGGGMRGAVSAGMAAAIASLGLTDAFDSVYGSSAGCIVGAYMISRQMCIDVYTQVLPAAKSRFASKRRVVSNVGVGLVSEWMDSKFSTSNATTSTTAETEEESETETSIATNHANNSGRGSISSRRSSSSSFRQTSSRLARKFQRIPMTLVESIKPYLNNLNPGMNISFVLDGVMSQQHGLRPFDFESFQINDNKQPLYAVASTVRNGTLETVAFSSRDGDYFDREIIIQPPQPKNDTTTSSAAGGALGKNNSSSLVVTKRKKRRRLLVVGVAAWKFLKTTVIRIMKIPVLVYQSSKAFLYKKQKTTKQTQNSDEKDASAAAPNNNTSSSLVVLNDRRKLGPRFVVRVVWKFLTTIMIRVIKIPVNVYQIFQAWYNKKKSAQKSLTSSSSSSSNETTTEAAAAAAEEEDVPPKEKKQRIITAAMSPLFRRTRDLPGSIRKRLVHSPSLPIFKIVQPFRKTSNGTMVQLQEASACPENSGKKGFYACIESSMLVPGAAGAPVKLLRSKFRQQAAAEEEEAAQHKEPPHNHESGSAATYASASASVLERYTSTCFDAFCYEPIPYRSAVANGATHVLALRSRPDGCVVETVPKVYETLVAPLYFRKHQLPQVVDFFERGGSQYRYLEDVLTLDEGLVVGCTPNDAGNEIGAGGGQKSAEVREHGIRVPPTDILFGTENDEDLEVDINSWKRAHMLPLILPAGTPELPTLTQDKDEVLEAVRNGFAAAFDVLAPIAGLDFDPATVDSKKIAELMFPRNDDGDDMYVLETPVNVKGDYIPTNHNIHNDDDDDDADSRGVEKKARRRFVDWIQRKRKERRTARWIARWNPVSAKAVEVERESPDTKQYVKAESLDWLEAEALLAMLPGFQDGRLSHLSEGLRAADAAQDSHNVREEEEEAQPPEESYQGVDVVSRD